MAAITNSSAQRFGNGNLAFEIRRFTDGGDNVLWRISASTFIGGNVRIEQDAKIGELNEMASFLQRAIEIVRTDGGRSPLETADEDA